MKVVNDFKYIIDSVILLLELKVKVDKLLSILLYVSIIGRKTKSRELFLDLVETRKANSVVTFKVSLDFSS